MAAAWKNVGRIDDEFSKLPDQESKGPSHALIVGASSGTPKNSLGDGAGGKLSSPGSHLAFAVPGDLATATGGYRYDRRIIQELRQLGWQVDVVDIGCSFPFPSATQRANALTTLSAIPDGYPIVIDGLAFGTLPEASELRRTSLIALVHQPLAFDPSFDATQADAFRATERAALSAAARVVVTSEATGRIVVADYDVAPQRISVVRPGNDSVPPAAGSRDGVVRLLSVGSVIPIKGYDVLIAALSELSDMPWQLTIAGDVTRDPATVERLGSEIATHGLVDRVAMVGAVPPGRVNELFLSSDVFVLASRFEGYGMALAEAIAHGLPIISTTAGAIPETIPAGAGLLVPPDDATALTQALRRLIAAPAERRWFAANARAAAVRLPTWQESARLFADAVETVR